MTNNQQTGILKNDSTARNWVSIKLTSPKAAERQAPERVRPQEAKFLYAATLVKRIHHLVTDFPLSSSHSRPKSVPMVSVAPQAEIRNGTCQSQLSVSAANSVLDVAQRWAASYFLPLLDSRLGNRSDSRDSIRFEDIHENEPSKIRIVTRPSEALKLPSLFRIGAYNKKMALRELRDRFKKVTAPDA